MINGEKIGVGIVTYNRFHLLVKLYYSLPLDLIDELIIVNDGDVCVGFDLIEGCKNTAIHTGGVGVGKAKNTALKYLKGHKCDHIFLIEDDIFIKDPTVFEKYIQASKVSGIQHFNFSQHGVMNKDRSGNPIPRLTIDYKDVKIPLYLHCVGAFSYYSKKCIDTVGYLDERYYNACEHVDHTFEIIKAGMHPSFWYFADIENSDQYLGDEPWSIEKSTISSNPNHKQMMIDADHIFVKKHGHYPGQTPMADFDTMGKTLKEIKNKYGRSNNSNL